PQRLKGRDQRRERVKAHDHGHGVRLNRSVAVAPSQASIAWWHNLTGFSLLDWLTLVFVALAYLGWFVSGYVLIVSTIAVMRVMWRRQFASDALGALGWPGPDRSFTAARRARTCCTNTPLVL